VLPVLPRPQLLRPARYSSYERKVRLMYGSTRVTAAVLPFQKERKPSSRQIRGASCSQLVETEARLTWYKILTRSIGAIAVLLTTPAIPPATKYSCAFPEPPMRAWMMQCGSILKRGVADREL